MPLIRRSAVAAAAVTALLAVSASACGPGDDTAGAETSAPESSGEQEGKDGIKLPEGVPTSLEDLKQWKEGGWKDWDNWARKASEFANPVIKNFWQPSRMAKADDAPHTAAAQATGQNEAATDPEPPAVPAKEVSRPYHRNMAPVGKVYFDSPKGPMVCSGTVVRDPAHPGKSNMVWTAGHCVHAGKKGGWMRNIVFVPSYNDKGLSARRAQTAAQRDVSPYGVWWADWSQTSSQWIDTGGETGGVSSSYDFAVLHVKPENGGGKSLEETVGAAVPVWFGAPSAKGVSSIGAYGYPAAPPYDGAKMFNCTSRPGRLSFSSSAPTMYRIGCSMTGGTSGGGWFVNRKGKTVLVSNSSISSYGHTWLAGPHLGAEAKGVFKAISDKYAGKR
ncbi:trypsin-like serine peptidase [Streptomyces cucumeris]|uniref:trypsin-like serine peptidase n=1 Tax=Streptomyces cucumeris TaxID=2962890 RepID=UPI003D74E070